MAIKQLFNIILVKALLMSCSSNKALPLDNSPTNTYKLNTIAFYNLENLFDTINDPLKNDEASPIMEIDPKMRGEVYWKKNKNIAKVISEIGQETAKNAPAVV